MTCADVAELADAFVDAELPGSTLLAVARHAGGCPACDESIRQLTSLHETVERTIRASADTLDLSGLWSGVEARMMRDDARRAWRRRLRAAPMWGAAAAMAAGVMLWLGGLTPQPTRTAARPRPNQAIIERINSEGGHFELRRERKYGTTLIMVSADGESGP